MRAIANGVILLFLIILTLLDIRKKEIPVFLMLLMSGAVAIFTVICPAQSVRSLLAGAGVGLLLFIISKCTKEAIGYGDSWLILLLGIYLGGLSVLKIMFAASLLSAVASLFCLWKCHWNKKVTIPFVPFLALAYVGDLLL